jgi:hypothetical protein
MSVNIFKSSNMFLRTSVQFAIVLIAGSVGLSFASTASSAGLDALAYNTVAQPITTDTMSLILTNGPVGAGFRYTASGMVPGDTVNLLFNLTNGTLAGQNLNFGITESADNLLTRDATKGLKVNIDQCSVAWTSQTVCSGTTTNRASNLFLSSINQTANPANTQLLISGAIATNEVMHLRIQIILPDQDEVTTNGATPVTTIQGLSNSITWKFRETQRTSTTTNG